VASWTDPREPVLAAVTALAAELSDPIRLTALQLLAAEGPHTMSRLAAALDVTAPRLGNHLTRLRAAGLVEVEHTGRHAVYRLGRPELIDVLTALSRYAGHELPTDRPATAADIVHTCYDHAAGRLGVALLAHLVDQGALTAPDGTAEELRLGGHPEALTRLGIDPASLEPGRRKLATACLDRTQRLPHLGGALGAQILDALVDRGLLTREDGTRVLVPTAAGTRELPRLVPGFHP
jgi:DNA-binding transcriptional ArsR family regulator